MSDVSSAAPEREVAEERTGRAWAAVALGWVVPGAGHFFLGLRGRALAFFLIVMASVALGWSLDGNLYRVLPEQPLTILATMGSMGMGAPYFVLRYWIGYEGIIVAPGYEYGTAFILTAGLMNLLLVLDVWDIARGRKE